MMIMMMSMIMTFMTIINSGDSSGGGDDNDLSNGKTGKGISAISGSNGTAKQKQKVEPEQFIW